MAVVETGYLEKAYLTFPYLSGQIEDSLGMQADMVALQTPATGMQVDIQSLPGSTATGMEVIFGKLKHIIHPKYLVVEDPYLTTSYLNDRFCALQGMQVEGLIQAALNNTGMQIEATIVDPTDDKFQGMQVELKIVDDLKVIGMQVEMLKTNITGFQVTQSIYNAENLRLMCNFASRGRPSQNGLTWTSVQPIKAGDFSPNNLNTDIFEERTQTDDINALWELRCNTGAVNTFVDTIAILEHNFSAGATVVFQASDDVNFGTVKFTENLVVEADNMYFIAPTLPTIPAQFFRFIIQDSANAEAFLRIGIIVFGSSQILTLKERFTNPVKFGKTHFKDTIETEGFTSVSNDRATRKFLGLNFRELDFNGGNFDLIQDYLDTAKTDLKCLIIPRPSRASSLAVFAKLVKLPDEQHNAIDDDNHFIELDLDWDESL